MSAAISHDTARRLRDLSEELRLEVLAGLSPEQIDALPYVWELWARPDQLPPPPPAGFPTWRTWLILAGRGWGKTKTGAEWVRSEAESGRRRQIAIIGPTADAVRRVQIEGPSGLLAVSPPNFRPSYEPSTRRVVWPNGSVAHLFSAEEPDRLRGPNLDGAWADEITSWADIDAVWDMLQMCLRVAGPKGDAPQAVVTTTPKPLPALKAIMKDPTTVTTRGKTMDNAPNLDPSTLAQLQQKYGNTTLGRQELEAELLEDAEGALWTRKMLDEARVPAPPEMRRIVVAVDPSGGSAAGNAETGIIVAGIDRNKNSYVLADLSDRYTPERWARRAIDAYYNHHADRIVCEQNFGGAMVESTIRAVDPRVPIKMVHASRGKVVRAEPVVALYEQHRVHHVGVFTALEDQQCQWEPDIGMASPDRIDALVWAITELALGVQAQPTRQIRLNIMAR